VLREPLPEARDKVVYRLDPFGDDPGDPWNTRKALRRMRSIDESTL
jgi:hypothetical protein